MSEYRKMAADVARCLGEACEERDDCLRFLSPPHGEGFRQVWLTPGWTKPLSGCENRIPIERMP